MTYKHIAMKDASDEQLRDYAKNVLQLDIHHAAKRATIIGSIYAAQEGDQIQVPADDAPQALQQPAQPVPEPVAPQGSSFANETRPVSAEVAPTSKSNRLDTDSSKDRMICVIVQKQQGKGGDRPAFVSVNGMGILIPRGKPCVIPERYIGAMNDAVQTVVEQDPETGELNEYDSPSITYQVLATTPPEAEWLKGRRATPAVEPIPA